jgi:hypothetical protein
MCIYRCILGSQRKFPKKHAVTGKTGSNLTCSTVRCRQHKVGAHTDLPPSAAGRYVLALAWVQDPVLVIRGRWCILFRALETQPKQNNQGQEERLPPHIAGQGRAGQGRAGQGMAGQLLRTLPLTNVDAGCDKQTCCELLRALETDTDK